MSTYCKASPCGGSHGALMKLMQVATTADPVPLVEPLIEYKCQKGKNLFFFGPLALVAKLLDLEIKEVQSTLNPDTVSTAIGCLTARYIAQIPAPEQALLSRMADVYRRASTLELLIELKSFLRVFEKLGFMFFEQDGVFAFQHRIKVKHPSEDNGRDFNKFLAFYRTQTKGTFLEGVEVELRGQFTNGEIICARFYELLIEKQSKQYFDDTNTPQSDGAELTHAMEGGDDMVNFFHTTRRSEQAAV